MKHFRSLIVGSFFLLLLISPNPSTASSDVPEKQYPVQPVLANAPESADVLITWFTHDVDTTSGRGRHNDIAIDSNGYPHISYIDEGTADLMYAYQDLGGWHRWILDGFNPVETIGWGTALVLDAENDPHILYFGTSDVRYMFRSGGSWYKEFVEPSLIGDGGDIFYGGDGTVYASYHEALTDLLIYSERNKNTGSWSSVLVDDVKSPGHNTSLVVESGYRTISYSRYEDPALMYASSTNGTDWFTHAIDSDVGLHATHTNMTRAPDSNYYICYFDWDQISYQLKVAKGIGSAWEVDLVDPTITAEEISPEVTSECSLAFDQKGILHLAYYDSGELKYAFHDQGGWHTGTTIEPDDINEEPAGRHNGLAIGPDDLPQVSYDYTLSPTLKHADVAIFVPDLIGDTSCTYGSRDCNRCAHDVVNSVAKLSVYGEPLGFHLGSHPDPSFNVFSKDLHGHWQGVQRISTTSGDYLVVSMDDAKTSDDGDWSVLGIVRMSSRDGDGYRWRSNRLQKNLDFMDTAPPDQDVITNTIWITNDHDHPGGIQIMGDYLAVGTDHEVRLYDMANPETDPVPELILDRPGYTSSSTSLAKLADGHYMLAVSNSDARQIDFYFSSQPNSVSDFVFYDAFYQDDHAYQSLNLVTECGTGDMYMIGTYNGGDLRSPYGEDRAIVFSIEKSISGEIMLEELLSKHFHCAYRGEADCNFDAAAGIYVDPSGQIILYSTEHDNEGPSGNDSKGTIKMKEFRPVPHINMCTDISQAWVELYDDHDFKDRNLMIDYIDSDLEDYSNLHHVEDFNDKPTSVRWCLPPDWRYSLYWDNSYGGKELVLTGTGGSREINNLKDHDFNKASSSKFVYDPAVQISISDILGDILYYRRSSGSSALMTIDEELNQTVGVDVEVPAGSVSQATTLTLTPVFPPAHPIDGYLSPDSLSFDLDLTPKGSSDDFLTPVTLRFYYEPQHAENIQIDSLAIYVWNEGGNQWVDAAHSCNPMSTYIRDLASGIIEVDICRTGEYILMGDRQYRVFLPSTLKNP